MNKFRLNFWIFILSYFFYGAHGVASESLTLTSSAFKDSAFIPIDYTKEGKDLSPPLEWKNVPKGTKSMALICDDPDAPGGSWIHWVLYNIPPLPDHLEEGAKNLSPDVIFGKNSWGDLSYGGPQPPSGTHHYLFTLYALDTVLKLEKGVTKEDLLKSIKGHVLDKATLTGLYHLQGR